MCMHALSLVDLDAIGLRGGAAEQPVLLVLRAARGDELESVPGRAVAGGRLVRREVAFEHAAVRPEGFDAGFDIGAPGRRQALRAASPGPGGDRPGDVHAPADELDANIR